MKHLSVWTLGVFLAAAPAAVAADRSQPVVVTTSNAVQNQLLVYDTAGTLVQSVATGGQGGVSVNAGGVAADKATVAVVNFGSQNVSVFSRGESGFELRELVPALSPPVSVAFGNDHLYVLGTTTVESHRVDGDWIDYAADGSVTLLAADGSAAQVGVLADQLILTEKSGTVETVQLRAGAPVGVPSSVALPADGHDTPFGLVTRGANAYVTIAHSDLIGLVKNGQLQALTATGVLNGPGQHSPCWIAVVGPYLYSSNSPSHTISRLVAGGESIVIDRPVAANTGGAPVDIAAEGDLLAVIESNAGDAAHVTQYRIVTGGDLVQTASTAIASPANGVAVVAGK